MGFSNLFAVQSVESVLRAAAKRDSDPGASEFSLAGALHIFALDVSERACRNRHALPLFGVLPSNSSHGKAQVTIWAVRVNEEVIAAKTELCFTAETPQGEELPQLAAGDDFMLIFPDHRRQRGTVLKVTSQNDAVITLADNHWHILKSRTSRLYASTWVVLKRASNE